MQLQSLGGFKALQIPPQELAEAYRNLSDDEIAALHAQIASLTADARAVLSSEIVRRGVNDADLTKLYAADLGKEAKFDQRQKDHRRTDVSHLSRGDPKWVIIE